MRLTLVSLILCVIALASSTLSAAREAPFLTAPPALPPPPSTIEFWVIEPNEGQSSGGHAAIRIDDWVYHVEHRGDGLIADRRTPRIRFEEIYRLRENRGIEALPLLLEPAARQKLKLSLEKRFYDRRRTLDRLDALEMEASWIERSLAQKAISIEIPGYGLFREGSCSTSEKMRNEMLLGRIRARYGPGWLNQRRQKAEDQTAAQLARLLNLPNDLISSNGNNAHGGFHRRLIEAGQLQTAFEVLINCWTAKPQQYTPVDSLAVDSGVRADPEKVRSWMLIREQLTNRLIDLVASERTDHGLSLLLGLARLESLNHSIEKGQLFILDPRRIEESPSLLLKKSLPKEWIEARERHQRAHWLGALQDFEQGEGALEARFATLERAHHSERHLRTGTLHSSRTTPKTAAGQRLSASIALHYISASRELPWPQGYSHLSLEHTAKMARQRANQEREKLQRSIGYHLITKNCVTELLSVLESVTHHAPSTRSVTSGHFVPALAANYLENIFRSDPRRKLPSARQERLIADEIQSPWRQIAEQTTLTSRFYRPHPADSSFLFFTDQSPWSRPILGTANLGYGLITASVGLITSPFDRGQKLRRGLQGAVMSVPEIFFWRIRRGTYLATHPIQREHLSQQ